MNAQRHARISEVFLAACEIAPDDRADFLLQQCAEDDELRQAVEALLEHDSRPAAVDRPLIAGAIIRQWETALVPDRRLPEKIGQYEILGLLGEGGMGVVYKARQRNPPRTVALKMIHHTCFSPRGIRRFEFEAEILARLKHPGIAQIFDAGAVEGPHGSQPFFALELVEGVPLTHYARNASLDMRERLDLLAKICDAVHHAHQRGVIHRDLKPANILVEQSGRPKILDFGVARATDHDLTVTTEHGVGQVIGTIPYMSPEQIRGSRDEVDVRSDVYSLGVIAYELLRGSLPYDLRSTNIAEAARIVQDQEIPLLGTAVSQCRGDVETIVAKALEKDKERRYPSASDLAADLRRYLHNEPIIARPATTFYHFRKLVARHKIPFALATGLFAACLVFGFVVTVQAIRLAQERDAAQAAREEAERQTHIAVAVNNFVNDDLLGSVAPERSMGHDVTVREILDKASVNIGNAFEDEPLVEASIRTTIGQVYYKLGRYAEAGPHLQRAVTLRRDTPDANPQELIDALAALGELFYLQRDHEQAAAMFREAVDRSREAFGEQDERTVSMLGNLGLALKWMRDFEAAEKIMRESLDFLERRHGSSHPDVAATLNNLGSLLFEMHRYEESEQFYQRALAIRRELEGEESLEIARCLSNLAGTAKFQDRLDEAEALFRESLAMRLKILGPDHPSTANTLGGLATVLRRMGQHREAITLLEESKRVIELARGADDPQVADINVNIGQCHLALGQLEDAERLLAANYPKLRERYGLSSPFTIPALVSLVEIYDAWEKPEQRATYEALLAEARTEQNTDDDSD